MRIVIVEDELAALEQLKMLLKEHCDLEIDIVETIDSVEDCINFFSTPSKTKDVDLVFMDIHLSDGYAFSVFKHVDINIPIIFTTAYDEYALEAFAVNCIDYILKPISKTDIDRIFSKIKIIAQYSKAITSVKYLDTLLVSSRWQTTPLNVNDIAFFYKSENKIDVYDTSGKKYQVNTTMEKLEEQLDSKKFMRANRQFIISKLGVKEIESWDGSRLIVRLNIETPEKIIVSRTKVTQFKQWLVEK